MPDCDVVILGAGAAGLFCAATAGARGRTVVVLDHAERMGRKILISGGGRCNFTNRSVGPGNYLSQNPHFCRSALARFRPEDFLALVEAHRIPFEERRHGQLFCTGSAQAIVGMLASACECVGVVISLGTRIERIERSDRFQVVTAQGTWTCASLVVATGGLTIPTLGASDLGYRLARQFGHAVIPTAPALAPLLLPPAERLDDLSGIAVEAQVSAGGTAFRENLLFTHHGISGPVVLQASSYWQPGGSLEVDLLPGVDLAAELAAARTAGVRAQVGNHLAERLPRRLLQRRLDPALAGMPVRQLSNAGIAAVTAALTAWALHPSGSGGYAKAEVTRGGVDTAELSSQTMASRRIPGLYFVGEVVDVTGWLGGYNFHWAWASGHAAGNAV